MRTLSESTTRRAEPVVIDDDRRRQAERHCKQTGAPRLFTHTLHGWMPNVRFGVGLTRTEGAR